MSESLRFPAAALIAFTRDSLQACGVPDADAAIAAKAMIEADLTGFDAHGIFRLTAYVGTLKSGRVNPKANIRPIQRSPATALVDGDDGIGHLVMTYCANLAVELARQSGVGWVGARRSNHAGAAGIYAEIPVAHGMVGIYAAVSTINNMAPWGGAETLLGTNPIAIGIPAGKEAPVLLDIATSVSSFGNIRRYAIDNKPMPEGWVVHSKTGEPITDPKKVSEGVLLPIGGHKGSGLALIIGLLAGRAQRRRLRQRCRGFHGPWHQSDQHRAVRDRARHRALHFAGGVRGRDGSSSQRIAFVADLAGLRRDTNSRRGAPPPADRQDHPWSSAAADADQAAR